MEAGIFIKASSKLDDDFFTNAIVFITEYNKDGAIGLVVNKPFGRNLNELEEFRHSLPYPLHDGGPVDRDHIYFIHRRPDLVAGGMLITDGIYMGGDFTAALKYLNNKTIGSREIRLFVGYCGWDRDELDKELAEESWLIVDEQQLF